jgi:hypothetical protein
MTVSWPKEERRRPENGENPADTQPSPVESPELGTIFSFSLLSPLPQFVRETLALASISFSWQLT